MPSQQRPERESKILHEIPVTLRRIVLESNNDYSDLSAIELIEYGAQHLSEIIKVHRQGIKLDQQSVDTHLVQLMEDALTLTGEQLVKRGVQLTKELVLASRSYRLPRNQMLQALINLIINASDSVFTQFPEREGGRITLHLENISQRGKPWLLISVKDNGVGIAVDEKEKVLEYGYSTKRRGSGFGLHATDNFLRSLGGEVVIYSDGAGKGAIISLLFPALKSE